MNSVRKPPFAAAVFGEAKVDGFFLEYDSGARRRLRPG